MTKISLSPADWVHRPRPLQKPLLRLFCLPYGGGEATLFRDWPMALPTGRQDQIEICPLQLPGRAHRIRERPLFTSMAALIDVLVPLSLPESPLYPYLDTPFAFFGASLGGLICFEVARALSLRHQREAVALCIASCRAPHLPGPILLDEEGQMSHDHLLHQLQEYGGTPASLLEDERLMKVVLPKLRADALLSATYAYLPDLGPDCPITVIGGHEDSLVSVTELLAWQEHTRRAFRLYTLPGDHFFVRDGPQQGRMQMMEYICRTVEPSLDPPVPLGDRSIEHLRSQGLTSMTASFVMEGY